MTAAPVAADRLRPPWCGKCGERTRLVELDDGRAARCPRCHPLLTAEQADAANERAWRAAYGSLPPQKPITEEKDQDHVLRC